MCASATHGGYNTFIAYFTVVTGIAKAGGVAGRISANRPRIFFLEYYATVLEYYTTKRVSWNRVETFG